MESVHHSVRVEICAAFPPSVPEISRSQTWDGRTGRTDNPQKHNASIRGHRQHRGTQDEIE